MIPTDSATNDQARRYREYAASRFERTKSPQGLKPNVAGGPAPEPNVAGGPAPEPNVAGGPAPEPNVAGGPAPEPNVAGGPTPRGLLFAPDLVGTSDELADQLFEHAGFQGADEVAFALPFAFGETDYR